jgi:hypothetical protein
VDKRLRRYVPLDVFIAFEQPGLALKTKWGMEGVCSWALFLAACKREPIQGMFTYCTEDEGWGKLGAKATQFSLAELFDMTGRLKKTSRRRSGQVVYVSCTNWGKWNDEYGRQLEAEKKARSRAQNTGDNTPTVPGRSADDLPTDSELESERERERPKGFASESLIKNGTHVHSMSSRDQYLAIVKAREGAA